MKNEEIKLDLEPIIKAMRIITERNMQTIEKIEKGIKVDYGDLFILEHSTLCFSLLNNKYKNWRSKK